MVVFATCLAVQLDARGAAVATISATAIAVWRVGYCAVLCTAVRAAAVVVAATEARVAQQEANGPD